MSRVMELAGDVEDSSLIEDDTPSKPESRMRRIFAAGAVLLAGAALCAVLFGRTGAAPAAVEAEPETELVRADAESKFPWGYDVVEMCGVDYKIEEVLHSNFGEQGPGTGAEGIKYRCSESVNHNYKRDIIVEINAVSKYQSKSAHLNGIAHDFGSIHVDAGESVKMLVHFMDMDGKPLELETFRMTFYDLDEAPHHLSQEYIIADHHPSTLRDAHSEVKRKTVHGSVEFEATKVGNGKDNPDDSSELTHQQEDRSVVLTYHDIKQFHVTLGSHKGHSPRAFEFALHSALSCHKGKVAKTSTTTTTTTQTSTVTTTTIDPAIIAAQQKMIAIAVGSVVAAAALAGLIAALMKMKQSRELAEIAYFEGTS